MQSGQPITLTVMVTSNSGSQTPSGGATVSDGSTPLGTLTLDAGGKGTLSTSSLAVGAHSITASYLGAMGFGTSVSGAVSVTVSSAPTNSHSGGGAMDGGTLGALGDSLRAGGAFPIAANKGRRVTVTMGLDG